MKLVVPSLPLLKGLVKQCLGNLWSSIHCGGLLKKSISCADCVGMNSLVLVSFIEFCLASSNDEVVNIAVIFLDSFSFSLSLVCACVCGCVFLKVCTCAVHVTITQCLGVSVFFSTFL